MLPSLHVKGLLTKMPTDTIEMVPNMQATIMLSDLNQMIAEQQGMSVQDLAVKRDPKYNAEIQELAKIKELPTAVVAEEDLSRTTSSSVNQTELSVTATPEETAKHYRSQADKLAKEAAKFRRLAEDIAPTKKKVAEKE
jgi:hypothetical protein